MKSFLDKVIGAVSQIPLRKMLTYKEVAKRAGNARAYRAVGNILHSYDAAKIKVPCHRVVRSDGKVGGYRWSVKKKIVLLKQEGSVLIPRRS